MKMTENQFNAACLVFTQHQGSAREKLQAVFDSMEAPQTFTPGPWLPIPGGGGIYQDNRIRVDDKGFIRQDGPALAGHAVVSRETILKYANNLPKPDIDSLLERIENLQALLYPLGYRGEPAPLDYFDAVNIYAPDENNL